MGANLSAEENYHYQQQQRRRSSQQSSSKYVMGKKTSSSSSIAQSPSIIQHSIDLVSNENYIIDSTPNVINTTATTTTNNFTPPSITTTPPNNKALAPISEKRKGKLPATVTSDALNHLDKLPLVDRHNSSGFSSSNNRKSSPSQQQRTTSSRNSHYRESRYSSILSASGFSNHHDSFQFSTIAGDSVITDMSRFSFNSYNMDNKQICDDNDYIMSVPDFEYPPPTSTESAPNTGHVSTMEEILDLLKQRPNFTHDILTDIFASTRIRNNPDLQREAYQAAEVWSLRPDDVSAKICVARCKLCGWGTSKNPRQGFSELQSAANKNNWEAYYHLAQCYYYGVEEHVSASEGYTLAGGAVITKTNVIQPVDQDLALTWYKKVINTPCDIKSERINYIIAQAKLLIAVTNFTTDQITRENLEENVNYIKDSAYAGNRKSEFLLALLLRTERTTDSLSAKEYYLRSANKGYTPSQIELGLLLLRENSPQGISWLNKAAALGDSGAYYHLGQVYEFGIQVEINHALALTNYQVATDNFNDRSSQFRLGFHYLAGTLGLERDDGLAFTYLSKAASNHHAESQYFLGIMYRDGKVPPSSSSSNSSHGGRSPSTTIELAQHKKEALRLFRQSASQSIHAAITETATCYEKGIGTAVNHGVACEYYEKAISLPGPCLPSAQLTFATFLHKMGKYQKALQLYYLAGGLESSHLNTHPGSESVVRTAKLMIALFHLDEKDTTTPYKPKEAFDMLLSLTQDDSPSTQAQTGEAHYWLAVCYEEGVSGVVKPNLSKSFDHYLVSAKLGYSNSQFQVGHMLCKGLGVKEDRLAAFDWLQAAAKQNHANALYYVGIYYYNGSGSSIARNLDLARDYFKQSAELGNAESMVSYAQICYEKLNKDKNLSTADAEKLQQVSIRYYKKAAHVNHPTALRELGRIYGAKKDFKVSAEYYEKAAKLNDALSTVILGGYYEHGHGVAMNKQTALSYYEKAIELGQPTALFAIAELYDKLKTYDKAYHYYKRVTQDARISTNFKSSKTSRFKMALYSLNYDSNTLLNNATTIATSATVIEPVSSIQTSLAETNISTLSASEAFHILTLLANQEKFIETYFWIAQCYQDGNGVSQNTNAQIHWLTKAFKEGDMNATMELASIYEHGHHGVEKNIPYAYQLYQICGERNIVKSQHKLGLIFWRGLDIIPINLGMAVIWFTRSARQSYAPSHWALGQIALENGDLHIAIAWWETAMKLNPSVSHPYLDTSRRHLLTTTTGGDDAEALITLGKIIQQQQDNLNELQDGMTLITIHSAAASLSSSSSRDEVKESLSRAQQENHGLAVQCFGQAALMGNVEGMYLSAQAWHQDKDYPIALENYEKAASQGHIPSRIMRATYQIYGLGGKKIDTKAGFEELLVCSKIDPDAHIHLGRCYERGLGTSQSLLKALECYHMATETTHSSEAMFRIGQIYANQKRELDAIYWYQQAISKSDHPRAHFKTATYYAQGVFKNNEYLVRPDLHAAVYHLRSAAKQNDLEAMFKLGQLLLTTKDERYALFSLDLQSEGVNWLEVAADKGSRDAQRELGNIYHAGREGLDDFDDDEGSVEEDAFPIFLISQDFEKAYDYFSFAAHLGDKASALFLGTYYEHGICVPPSIELAQSWYTMAIQLGANTDNELPLEEDLSHPSGWWPAQLCLARVLHQNEETQDQAYALFSTVYYSHRPEQHMEYLEMILAQYELYGLGSVSVQEEKAVFKLLHLADHGYIKAFFLVAQCYENGTGIHQDLAKALDWYVALIHHPMVVDQDTTFDEDDLEDLAHAYFCLAEFYRLGKVVAMDQEKSNTLYQIAADRGSKEALDYLMSCSSH